MKRLPIKAILTAILCNVLFGSAVPVIKYGYEAFGIGEDLFAKILFMGIRFFLSGILLFFVGTLRQKIVMKIDNKNRGIVIGVALIYTFLQYLFTSIGVSNTTGARATLLTSTSAFMSILLAHFCYRNDRLNRSKIWGSILGFAGILFMCFTSEGGGQFTFAGDGFMLCAAFWFVVGSILNKKATKKHDALAVTAYNLLIGGFLLALVGMLGNNKRWIFSIEGILCFVYLILVSSVGFTIWSNLLRQYPIGKLGIYNFVIPMSGAISSALILQESIFNLKYLISFVLVCIGIIVVNSEGDSYDTVV